jgi:hypothetical protein
MRLIAVGVVFIGVGVFWAEYTRRHPLTEQTTPSGSTGASLVDTVSAAAHAPTKGEHFAAGSFVSRSKGEITLQPGVSMKHVRAGFNETVLLLESKRQFALVGFRGSEPPVVYVKSDQAITASAINAGTLYFSEGPTIYRVNSTAPGVVTPVIQFKSATVSELSASDKVLIATVTPVNADPFATEATSAVVRVDEANRKASLVAGEQIRPHDIVNDDREVFWISGYPAALNRAPIDGSFSARIAERADGPLSLRGEDIVFRYPEGAVPEIRSIPRTGGNTATLAQGDAEWVAVSDAGLFYATAGLKPEIYFAPSVGKPQRLASLSGAVKGLAATGSTVGIAYADEAGLFHLLYKP